MDEQKAVIDGSSECVSVQIDSLKGFSREINYHLFSLIQVYIFCETEYMRVFCYLSYGLETPWHTTCS